MKKVFDYSFGKFERILLALFCLILFLATLTRPFVDHDVLIYSIVGRAIFERGLLPYEFAFDHKPLFTYYIYGLISVIFPIWLPIHQLLTACVILLTATLTRFLAGTEKLKLHFILMLFISFPFIRFSGNTEIYLSLFSLLSFTILFKAKRFWQLVCSGAMAAIAVNINYLAVFVIVPSSLYLVASSARGINDFIIRSVGCILGFISGCLIIFMPMLLKDPALVSHYFTLQKQFLQGYREHSYLPPWRFTLILGSLCILMLTSMQCAPEKKRLRTGIVITILSGLAAAASSGKFYLHYGYMLVPPVVVLFTLSTARIKWVAMIMVVATVTVPIGIQSVRKAGPPYEWARNYNFSQFNDIKAKVGEAKVLSIRATHIPVYYAELMPTQPFIWDDHAKLVFGAAEDDYYNSFLTMQQIFVLAPATLCTESKPSQLPEVCFSLNLNYEILSTYGENFWGEISLYKRKLAG